MVHFYDTIVGYQCEIDVHAQGTVYKNAIENHDLQLLLLLVGLKNQVRGIVQMQIVTLKDLCETDTCFFHLSHEGYAYWVHRHNCTAQAFQVGHLRLRVVRIFFCMPQMLSIRLVTYFPSENSSQTTTK